MTWSCFVHAGFVTGRLRKWNGHPPEATTDEHDNGEWNEDKFQGCVLPAAFWNGVSGHRMRVMAVVTMIAMVVA